MKYPALDVTGVESELLEALVDDFSPTAIAAHDGATRVFFTSAADRDDARRAVSARWPEAVIASRDVDDEDWARRSQENLTPVTVGRITVTPPWHAHSRQSAVDTRRSSEGPEPGARRLRPEAGPAQRPKPGDQSLEIVITPSMGFGTGHHATTRLCLAALQHIELPGRTVLDVGTGSGVLALAGRALGADAAVGVDNDPDAIQAAVENLAINPRLDRVTFVTGDLRGTALSPADIVTANLMGALLVQTAPLLLSAVRPGGRLIVSGLLADEREDVVRAFASAGGSIVAEHAEDGWLALTLAR